MLRTRYGIISKAVLGIAAIGLGAWGAGAAADRGQAGPGESVAWASRVLAERFAETQQLIEPQPGESRWREIPWQTSLWEARQLAAAAGKPMFVWSGSGGAPCAPT
jgi:hypothetical protein